MVRRHPSSVARSVPGCPSQLPAQGQALLPPCQPRAQHQPLPCNTHPRSALMNLSWRSRRVGVHAAGPLQAACSSGSARAGRRHRQQPWGGGVGGRRETLRPESRPQQPQQVRVTGAGGQQPASPSSVHSHQPPATSHMRTPAPLHTHPCTPHTHILPPTYTTHSIPSPLAHTSTPHPILPPLHPRAPHLPLPHIPCIHTPPTPTLTPTPTPPYPPPTPYHIYPQPIPHHTHPHPYPHHTHPHLPHPHSHMHLPPPYPTLHHIHTSPTTIFNHIPLTPHLIPLYHPHIHIHTPISPYPHTPPHTPPHPIPLLHPHTPIYLLAHAHTTTLIPPPRWGGVYPSPGREREREGEGEERRGREAGREWERQAGRATEGTGSREGEKLRKNLEDRAGPPEGCWLQPLPPVQAHFKGVCQVRPPSAPSPRSDSR